MVTKLDLPLGDLVDFAAERERHQIEPAELSESRKTVEEQLAWLPA
jgi:hypothetical protein